MRKMWAVIVGFLMLSLQTFVLAGDVKASPKVEVSTPSAIPSTAVPPPASTPPVLTTPPPPVVPHRTDLNEMKGTLESKSNDSKTLRLTVVGGFNVEFTYDPKTTKMTGNSPVRLDDLSYGDELIVRYLGKDLDALEIERVNKAPRPY